MRVCDLQDREQRSAAERIQKRSKSAVRSVIVAVDQRVQVD
jgi:hypothetical protein